MVQIEPVCKTRKRDKDTKNKCMDTTGGKRGHNELGECRSDIYTLLILHIK